MSRCARLVRGAALLGTVLVGALTLGACSSGASSASLEHQACAEVHRSIEMYSAAGADAAQRNSALVLLRDALRPAAIASSANAGFQALTATLSESSRVPESQLVDALKAQCAAVLAGQ